MKRIQEKTSETGRTQLARSGEPANSGAARQWVRNLTSAARRWAERRRNLGELAALDDRTLRDIGLDREALRAEAAGDGLFRALRENAGADAESMGGEEAADGADARADGARGCLGRGRRAGRCCDGAGV